MVESCSYTMHHKLQGTLKDGIGLHVWDAGWLGWHDEDQLRQDKTGQRQSCCAVLHLAVDMSCVVLRVWKLYCDCRDTCGNSTFTVIQWRSVKMWLEFSLLLWCDDGQDVTWIPPLLWCMRLEIPLLPQYMTPTMRLGHLNKQDVAKCWRQEHPGEHLTCLGMVLPWSESISATVSIVRRAGQVKH